MIKISSKIVQFMR